MKTGLSNNSRPMPFLTPARKKVLDEMLKNANPVKVNPELRP